MDTDSLLLSSHGNLTDTSLQVGTLSTDTGIGIEHDSQSQFRSTKKRSRRFFKHRETVPLQYIPKKFAYMFRPKTWWELVLISGTMCGLEFCYSAETAYVTPLLLSLGLDMKFVTMIWCLSPLIGLIITPILGSMSDSCESQLGRRRPFILIYSIGIMLGLFLVPNGQIIGQALGDSRNLTSNLDVGGAFFPFSTRRGNEQPSGDTAGTTVQTWSIVFTVIGAMFMDFCGDSCQSPTRTLVLDVSIPRDHAAGLSTFALMAGLGGSLGYVIGAINWEQMLGEYLICTQLRVVFTLVALVFVACMLSTLCSFPEIPLPLLRDVKVEREFRKRMEDSRVSDKGGDETGKRKNVKKYGSVDRIDEILENTLRENGGKRGTKSRYSSQTIEVDDSTNEIESHQFTLSKELVASREHLPVTKYIKSIFLMPNSIKILCLTDLFSWMSIHCYTLYFTDFVGESVFGGDPLAPPGTPEFNLYSEGVRFGCWGMAMSSLSCAVYSLIMEKLVRKIGCKKTYVGGQLVFSLGMVLMAVTRHKVSVILLSLTTGVMLATLFTIPYILMANYHCKNQFTDNVEERSDTRGIGTDVATVSSMTFVGQIILCLSMGAIVEAVGSTVTIVCAAALLSGCGALCATRVMYLDI